MTWCNSGLFAGFWRLRSNTGFGAELPGGPTDAGAEISEKLRPEAVAFGSGYLPSWRPQARGNTTKVAVSRRDSPGDSIWSEVVACSVWQSAERLSTSRWRTSRVELNASAA